MTNAPPSSVRVDQDRQERVTHTRDGSSGIRWPTSAQILPGFRLYPSQNGSVAARGSLPPILTVEKRALVC